MNKDLETDLNGLEPDLKGLVATLRAAPQARVAPGFTSRVLSQIPATERKRVVFASRDRGRGIPAASFWSTAFPIAAGLVALLAFCSIFFRPVPTFSLSKLMACQRPDGTFTSSPAAPYVQAFAVTVLAKDPSAPRPSLEQAVAALVRTQGASGGWANNALSMRNVAALAAAAQAGVAAAPKAYKRGLRFLRSQGLDELSADAFAEEARQAFARLASSSDSGLTCSVALCARR